MTKRIIVLAAIAALSTPAFAQNDVCMDQNGNVDQNATAGWQQFQANANSQAMQQLIGVWYTEVPNQLNPSQVAQRYTTFEPSGLFTTTTRVCSNGQMCSDYPGHGFWASQMQGNTLVTMSIFSDTQVTNYCNISQVQFNGPNMMQDSNGQVSQKVQ
ncbi:hypothetical protein [Devosia sp.]|uniref:hypothetical protein n=1 Tax=Devosia sp. TaxID=1871048 RepID=UPI00326708D8